MGARIRWVRWDDLTDCQRDTLVWLDGQSGPVSEADVFTSGVGRWLDLPDLQAAGQAFEDSKGWWGVRNWCRINAAFLYKLARPVARSYRQYELEDVMGHLVQCVYQFARTMKPAGGATMLTYVGQWGPKNVLRELCYQSSLVTIPRFHGDSGRKRAAIPVVTHFGVPSEDGGVPEPAVEDDTEHTAHAAEVWEVAMRALKPRYRAVLRRRMQGELLGHIARSMGLTRERVRQIEFKGLNLVRERLGVPQVERPKKSKKEAAALPGVGT